MNILKNWQRLGKGFAGCNKKTAVARKSKGSETAENGFAPCLLYFLGPIRDQRMMLLPVISSGCGRPMIFSIVGAMSASTPPSRSVHG